MTEEELAKVPFKWFAHFAMEHEHTTSYVNNEYGFGFCQHVPYKNGTPKGRCYTHYNYKGKVYKSKAKFLEAIKDVEFKENT